MFGQGIYFATKSAQEMYTKGSKCLLLCDVLLGSSCTIKGLATDHPLKAHNRTSSTGFRFLDVDRDKVRTAGFDSVFVPRDKKAAGARRR